MILLHCFGGSDRHLPFRTSSGVITWYSMNQEILQAAKKDQLRLAYSLDNQGNGIYCQLRSLPDTVLYPRKLCQDSVIWQGNLSRLPNQL